MNRALNVVQVGCGQISNTWLKAVKTMPDLAMVGFVDLNPTLARQQATEYGTPTAIVGTDLTAVLAQTMPDIVFDCAIPEAHYRVVLTALEHGCHVLSEKPMADTLEHAREMITAMRRSNKLHAVIQNRRYDPNIRCLKGLIDSGALGPLTTLNSDFYIGAHFDGFRATMPHVLLLDMAIHTFDAARFLSGADPVSVYCKEWNPRGSWYAHDASAVAIFEMTNGIIYTYRGSWCAEGLATAWEGDWRIIGEKGTAVWDGASNIRAQSVVDTSGFLSTFQNIDPSPYAISENVDGHASLIREFVNCVRTGTIPETIGSDNIKSLAMVLGAIESAESGKSVMINV